MVDIHCVYVLHSEDETDTAFLVSWFNLYVKVILLLRGVPPSMRSMVAWWVMKRTSLTLTGSENIKT